MLDRFLDALTGRRLGGALFVLAGLIVAAAVLWPREDEGDAEPRIQPVRIVSVPQLGFTLAHPRAWKRKVDSRVVRLTSPEGAAVLTFSSPIAGSHARRVRLESKAALRTFYAPASIVRDGRGMLGSRRVRSFELQGRSAGKPVRALVFVDATLYRTYVVVLLTPARPSAKRLAEAQQILATWSVAEPVASKR